MAERSRYRSVIYLGGKILESRELNKQQAIDRLVDDNNLPSGYELGAIYREGATLNVQPSITGMTVSLAPLDATQPMLVFVRGAWEKLRPDFDVMAAVTFDTGMHSLYLNYSVRIVTSAEDTSLIDVASGEPTAEMGELKLTVSVIDTSAVALGPTEAEKNTAPIELFRFIFSGGVLVVVPLDNVKTAAKATDTTGGPVTLTTATAAGEACAADDPRLSDMRTPSDGSVTDAKLKAPVSDGSNTTVLGTQLYQSGAVSAARILWNSTLATVSDGLDWIYSALNALTAAFTAHKTTRLGASNTHPIPTAAEVGAAPASHVGQALGIAHPPLVNTNHGGFEVVRDASVNPNSTDYAYQVEDAGGALAGVTHQGDVYSKLADQSSYNGTSFGLFSVLAAAFSTHAAARNPHGLTLEDLGGASIGYVDTQDAGVLAASKLYTDTVAHMGHRASTHRTGGSHTPTTGGYGIYPAFQTQTFVDYEIFQFGQHVEIAIGHGAAHDGDTVPLPEDTGWTAAQSIVLPSMQWLQYHYDEDRTGVTVCNWSKTNNKITIREHSNGHSENTDNWANLLVVYWRLIS